MVESVALVRDAVGDTAALALRKACVMFISLGTVQAGEGTMPAQGAHRIAPSSWRRDHAPLGVVADVG